MDFDRLWNVADLSRSPRKLSPPDVTFVRATVPKALAAFPRVKAPARIHHPAGFTVSGAPVGTFLRSALLLAGQKALGRRFGGAAFYEDVERDLALWIMRSHFHHGYPKGTHCCSQCTLAVYPVLEAGAIRYFDCKALASDVRSLLRNGEWRFATPPTPAMARWALDPPGRSTSPRSGGNTKVAPRR